MRELDVNEIKLVSGSGNIASGLVSVGIGSVSGLASGATDGAIWGARAGGLVDDFLSGVML